MKSKVTFCILIGLFAALFFTYGCAGSRPKNLPQPEDFVWPLPPELPKIQFVRSIHSEMALGERKRSLAQKIFEAVFGRPRLRALKKPLSVHVDTEGKLYVTDTHWRKVLVFNFKKNELKVLGKKGKGMLLNPLGVATDKDGYIFVTDAGGKRVVIYKPDQTYFNSFGGKDTFDRPFGIAINNSLNLIYIVDIWAHQVKVFDKTNYKLLFILGKNEKKGKKIAEDSLDKTWNRGSDNGEFNFPTNIAIDKNGNIYVVDTMNFRVQVFNPRGNFLYSFGRIGNVPGTFSRPKGIGIDSFGHVYVADAAFNNIQIFTPKGRLLLAFGNFGSGLADLRLPAGMCIDGRNRIYVVDQLNHRVQVYQFLGEEKATNDSQ